MSRNEAPPPNAMVLPQGDAVQGAYLSVPRIYCTLVPDLTPGRDPARRGGVYTFGTEATAAPQAFLTLTALGRQAMGGSAA